MSIGIGQKIGIGFTEKLTGDVTGKDPTPMIIGDYYRPTGTATGSSRYSSSYDYSMAFDGNTNTQWYTTSSGTQWIQIDLGETTWVGGFRWYVGTSYRPNEFTFQGSHNGTEWANVHSSSSPDVTGWHAFLFTSIVGYRYYRWSITSKYSSYLYLYEIELKSAGGNELAFTISGEQYQYVNGPLIEVNYQVTSVELHADYPDDKHLLLTFHPQSRFNNAEGNLTVAYDQSIGNLRGRGGFLESFTEVFLPVSLEPKPNPGLDGHLHIEATPATFFTKVYYVPAYSNETIVTSIEVDAVLTFVGVVNP